MDQPGVLICAGRTVEGHSDLIRRYCGLAWSGGPPETWAFRYYEEVPTRNGDVIDPFDVLTCGALHGGFSRADLAFFFEQKELLESWLIGIPDDIDIADADESLLREIASLPELTDEVGLSLLSKVAHRKRPRLVPLFDRAISDWYRPRTGLRGVAGWTRLVSELHDDLAQSGNRDVLSRLRSELAHELGSVVPSELRLVDIAIWMASVRS